jgi:hypothetical protein
MFYVTFVASLIGIGFGSQSIKPDAVPVDPKNWITKLCDVMLEKVRPFPGMIHSGTSRTANRLGFGRPQQLENGVRV